MATQLSFDFAVPVRADYGPKGLRLKRGRPVPESEIRALYTQLRDIKRVALQLRIHERRVRPVVHDLRMLMHEAAWTARRARSRSTGGSSLMSRVPAGTRYRCQCCGALVVSTEEEPETTCLRGTRAPWLPAPNPFTRAERMGMR